jgi:hypothetical protein
MKTSIMESEVAAAPPPELGSLDGKLRAMHDFAKAFPGGLAERHVLDAALPGVLNYY